MLRAISWLLYPWGDQLQQFPLSRGQVVSALTAAFEILVQLVEVGAQHRKKCAVSRVEVAAVLACEQDASGPTGRSRQHRIASRSTPYCRMKSAYMGLERHWRQL